mgnify:FL=1
MVSNFLFYQPVKIFFGEGKLAKLDEVLAQMGIERAVLVCDSFFAAKGQALCENSSRIHAVFAGVEPNPQLSGAKAAVELCRQHNAQAVIGMGGGSSIDTAKFTAAIAMGEHAPEEYYQGLPFPENRLKIVAIPTTSGTGSEVTQVSVMNNGKEKKTINNPAFMPTAAVIDPELMYSVPPRTTMITGLDALSHALEGYWSKNHQPLTDLCAIEAVRYVLGNLERAYQNGGDKEARNNMAYAALLAGLTFGQPKTAASHACSYPLSMDYHLPHGEACAFTLDSFVRINADERLEALCVAVGLKNTEELAERIRDLKALAGLRKTLGDLGDVDVDKLAKDCAAHPLMNNNPVAMDAFALKAMFEALR